MVDKKRKGKVLAGKKEKSLITDVTYPELIDEPGKSKSPNCSCVTFSRAVQVVLAANDLPSINDVTYPELIEIIAKV
ncbi:DUF89 domain-containing protein [Psidium guajava]|nr:DUF89 domain-containing protein [Psidium guajava]